MIFFYDLYNITLNIWVTVSFKCCVAMYSVTNYGTKNMIGEGGGCCCYDLAPPPTFQYAPRALAGVRYQI